MKMLIDPGLFEIFPGIRAGKRKERIMKILMYNDGTEYAKEALPVVKMHAKAFHAHVDIVSSLPRGGGHDLGDIERRENELAYLRETLEKEKIPCDTHLLIKGNDAGDDLIEFTREHQIDEIIIGTQKKSRVEKFLLGSVAQQMIIEAQCPVVVT